MTTMNAPVRPSSRRTPLPGLLLLSLLFSLRQILPAETRTDTIAVPLSNPSRPVVLKADIGTGSITISGYDGDRVTVSARLRYWDETIQVKNGTAWKVPTTTTDLHVEELDNVVTVRAGSSPDERVQDRSKTVDVVIRTPRRCSADVRTTNLGDITLDGLEGDIVASNQNGSVILKRISGSAIIDVLSGNITATFARVDSAKPMSFSILNGNIDVSFPPSLKANVTLRSDWGEVYSDFNVEAIHRFVTKNEENSGWGEKNWMRSGKTAQGQINGGGQEIQFNNFGGKTYLRKLK